MKKSKLAPRNPLIGALLFKKSGAHQKTNKALRRREKQMTQKTAADCGRFTFLSGVCINQSTIIYCLN